MTWAYFTAARLLWLPVAVLVLAAVQLLVWSVDRAPPFEILTVAPTTRRAGERIDLQATVRRDLARRCSVAYTRQIFDARGFRHDLEGVQFASWRTVDTFDRLTPGELRVSVAVPGNAAPGPAQLVTTLLYECNPLHRLWPIEVVATLPFNIDPP